MLSFLLSAATAASSAVSVGDIALADLVRYSDRIVIGRVEHVVPVERGEPPTRIARFGFDKIPSVHIAEVSVVRTLKGEPEQGSVLYLADSTWICDITGAVPGEELVLFLQENTLLDQEGATFHANLGRRFGQRRVHEVLWSGRGRMPLWNKDGRDLAVLWDQVQVPDDLELLPGPDPEYEFIQAVPVDLLEERIRSFVVSEQALWIRAVSGRSGLRGERGFGWTLEVHGDRSLRIVVEGPDGRPVRDWRRVIPAAAFSDLQRDLRSVRKTPWTGSIGRPGSPSEGTRLLELTLPDQEATIRIFNVEDDDMRDPDRALETRKALRLWSQVRSLFREPGCVDRRKQDARWIDGPW